MHFCNKCGNMYYVSLIPDNDNVNVNLVYNCKKCGNIDNTIIDESVVVSKTNIKKKTQQYKHMINKYTKLDPTLPRVNNIDCPNEECVSSRESANKESIYIRYDNENMKYIYLCTYCETIFSLNQ